MTIPQPRHSDRHLDPGLTARGGRRLGGRAGEGDRLDLEQHNPVPERLPAPGD